MTFSLEQLAEAGHEGARRANEELAAIEWIFDQLDADRHGEGLLKRFSAEGFGGAARYYRLKEIADTLRKQAANGD